MLPETQAGDYERSIIAGHYVFALEACRAIKDEAARELRGKGIELEDFLKDRVKQSILRYLHNFRLLRNK